MSEVRQLVVFNVDGQHYALHLHVVQRVVRAVEVKPLPKAPGIVSGIIDYQGQVIPVVDTRRRFRLPEREIDPSDQLIIATTPQRTLALIVDTVNAVIEPEGRMTAAEHVLPGLAYVQGVIKLADDLVLIHDLETFLSLEEEAALSSALQG